MLDGRAALFKGDLFVFFFDKLLAFDFIVLIYMV